MKKWVSLMFGVMLALAVPVSAFATGEHGASVDGANVDKVTGQVGSDNNSGNDGESKDNVVKMTGDVDAKISVDGLIEPSWDLAKHRLVFKEPITGIDGYYWLTWDNDNLYLLIQLNGAAKLWKDQNKMALLSFWYNGDEKNGVKQDGYVALTWPNMTVLTDNAHAGWFNPGNLTKSFAVYGDDVLFELKLPYQGANGAKLNGNTSLGLNIGAIELNTSKDATGQVTFPMINDQLVIGLKPSDIKIIPLSTIASLLGEAGQVGGVTDTNPGGSGRTGDTGSGTGSGTGGTGTGSGTGGTGTGGTGSGPSTGVGGATDTGGNGGSGTGPVTGVGGATDTGVVPSGMPQTGFGGTASDRTD